MILNADTIFQTTKKPNKSPARETTTKVPTKKVPTKKVTQETTSEKSSSTTILPVPTEIDTTPKTLVYFDFFLSWNRAEFLRLLRKNPKMCCI